MLNRLVCTAIIACLSLTVPLQTLPALAAETVGDANATAVPAAGEANPTTTASATPAAAPPAAATQEQPEPVKASEVYKQIQELVKEFYPKAKITITEKTMHFDEKCHQEMGYYSGKLTLAPQAGGILCDISLKSGEYEGKDKDRLPSETHDGFHSDLCMAPYSRLQKSHLMVHLIFPPDISIDFKERFKTVVNDFNAHEAPPEPPKVAVAPPEPSQPASPAAQQPAPSSSSPTSFGAARLSKYYFPEGRFRIMLPGSPKTSAAMQAGLRMVDYMYPEIHGTYNVSYVILPGEANLDAANAVFDKVAASLVKQMGGEHAQQSYYSLRDCPGRQIMIGSIKGKPDCAGMMRLFICGRYLYVLGAIGKKAWLSSNVVSQFLTSFDFATGNGNSEDQQRALLRKHIAEAEQAHERQARQDRWNRFDSDFRKATTGTSESHGEGDYR